MSEDGSSSSESVHEPCDPCEGQCPRLLVIGIILLGLLKMVLVAPFALVILWLGSAITISSGFTVSFLLSIFWCLTCWPCNSNCFVRSRLNPCQFCLVIVPMLLHPAMLALISCLCALLGSPFFAVLKPLLDTWTAWKWGKVWYLPEWFHKHPKPNSGLITKRQDAKSWGMSDARSDAFNGTLGVLAEACVLLAWAGGAIVIWHVLFAHNVFSGCEPGARRKRKKAKHKKSSDPEDVALDLFVEELKEVGISAMEAGLISRAECQDLEPFLILGLPGLVLLRCVVRTCDEEEVDEQTVEQLLNFLSKTYRDQGEGVMEVWGPDGNIYAFDESFDKALSVWLDAKEALDRAGFLQSDSEDEDVEEHSKKVADRWWWNLLCRGRDEIDKSQQVSEYAIFEAWMLFGERADTEGLQARAKQFLSAYDDLSQDRKSAINQAASKIRSVSLLISRTPSIQPRLMTVLTELGEIEQETCWKKCCERCKSLYDTADLGGL